MLQLQEMHRAVLDDQHMLIQALCSFILKSPPSLQHWTGQGRAGTGDILQLSIRGWNLSAQSTRVNESKELRKAGSYSQRQKSRNIGEYQKYLQ